MEDAMNLYQLVVCNPVEKRQVRQFITESRSVVLRTGPYEPDTGEDPMGQYCSLDWFEGCDTLTVGSYHTLNSIQERLPDIPTIQLSN